MWAAVIRRSDRRAVTFAARSIASFAEVPSFVPRGRTRAGGRSKSVAATPTARQALFLLAQQRRGEVVGIELQMAQRRIARECQQQMLGLDHAAAGGLGLLAPG
jgi:hypothetical protein